MSRTAHYREHYRQAHISRYYVGTLHLAFVLAFTLGGMAAAVGEIENLRWVEWLTLPATFLYANFVEYVGHRWVMHRPVKGLMLIFHRHTRQHHRFFTSRSMAMDSPLDFRAVLFPPVLMLFFFAAFALPAGALLALIASPNVGWLFVIMALAYYLNYELLHLAYHLPNESRWTQLDVLRRLRTLHQDHHAPSLMAHKNFNITYPIFDWLFGTRA